MILNRRFPSSLKVNFFFFVQLSAGLFLYLYWKQQKCDSLHHEAAIPEYSGMKPYGQEQAVLCEEQRMLVVLIDQKIVIESQSGW